MESETYSADFMNLFLLQVTLILVCELWTRCIVVNGALEESDSHEHTPFYDSHNHISEHDHFHEDGYCDCNSQGMVFLGSLVSESGLGFLVFRSML